MYKVSYILYERERETGKKDTLFISPVSHMVGILEEQQERPRGATRAS
jgi:hypothetical protein